MGRAGSILSNRFDFPRGSIGKLVGPGGQSLPESKYQNPMTKSDEIKVLHDAIAKLGRESYCGAWLSDQLPSIESALASDYLPDVYAFSIQEARIHADKIVAQSKIEAQEIEARAKSDAEKTRESACRFADSIRSSLKRDIESALHRIERF